MEISAHRQQPGTPPANRPVGVDDYFAVLQDEQARFVAAMRGASSHLDRDAGQLAHLAATQSRLTQQFFDAQRSILMRRADVDVEVAAIGRDAERAAAEIVDGARRDVAAGARRKTTTTTCRPERLLRGEAGPGSPNRSIRQEVAELGVSVVRTRAEADSLATVIDAAFLPDEPDCVIARRQLTALLEDWWTVEKQEGVAVIDDAHARAAMCRHIAAITAGEILERGSTDESSAATDPERSLAPALLPQSMLDAFDAALDTTDHDSLPTVLAALSSSLDSMGPLPALSESGRAPVGDLVIRLEQPLTASTTNETESADLFRRFWARRGSAPRRPSDTTRIG